MHLISFDASTRQLGKLKKGLPVRVKKGTGFNLVVNPSTYNLVNRAFKKDKGLELKLSPEELEMNQSISPEQHEELQADEGHTKLPYMEGGNIFKKIKRGLRKLSRNKTLRKIEKGLRPLTREMKKMGKEQLHQDIAELHMQGAEKYGDDPRMAKLMNIGADIAHKNVQGVGVGDILKKAKSLTKSSIGRARSLTGLGVLGDLKRGVRSGVRRARSLTGLGMGAGLYAYPQGRGMNAHDAIRLANMATAQANYQLGKMHNAVVHGQLTQPPVKRYWDEPLAPPSRGTGLHSNLIRGRGSLISQDYLLPPALQSQPYGANFHMQFMLPPQYKRYNDGGEVEGRGLYV
jgi:hypothetical protein